MKYDKPELVSVGTADSVVLGFADAPEQDSLEPTFTRPPGGVALGLDD